MSLSTHPEVCIHTQVLLNPNKLPVKIDSRMQCSHWKSWCPFCVSTHFYYWSLAVPTTDAWISTKGNHGLLSASFLPWATYAVRILTVVKGHSHAAVPNVWPCYICCVNWWICVRNRLFFEHESALESLSFEFLYLPHKVSLLFFH